MISHTKCNLKNKEKLIIIISWFKSLNLQFNNSVIYKLKLTERDSNGWDIRYSEKT